MKKNVLILLFTFIKFSAISQVPDTLQSRGGITQNSPYGKIRDISKLVPPNVAAFERKGNLPVDYSTGRLNYSVPLITIPFTEDLNISLDLSYDNSGLRPEDIPSWVGNGWNLNVGGVITQYIKGVNDFTASSGLSRWEVRQDLDKYNQNLMTPSEKKQYFLDALVQQYDTQFDVFSYNFMKHSGKFYFDRDTVKFMKEENLKIEYSGNGNFSITDDLGYIYKFDVSTISSGSFQEDYGGGLNFNEGTKTWYLTEVISPWNQSITISYFQDIGYSISETSKTLTSGFKINTQGTFCEQDPAYRASYSSSSRTVNQLLPTSVTYPGGQITFETIPRDDLMNTLGVKSRALQSIKQYNLDETLIHHWQFDYSYMGAPSVNDRLQLNSLNLMTGAVAANTFSFEYYPSYDYIPIPDMITPTGSNPPNHAVDYWGFYNGNSGNLDKIPQFDYSDINHHNSYPTLAGGGNRRPNANYSVAGMLRKVIYPDKGYTFLEYQRNELKYIFPVEYLSKYLRPSHGEISYEPVFSSPTATCDDFSINGEFTLTAAISNAQIYLNMQSNTLSDMGRIIIRKKDDQSVILDEFRSVDVSWIDFRYMYLAAGIYEYDLIPACNNPNFEPVSSAMFGISKPTSSDVIVPIGGNRIWRISDYPVAEKPVVKTLEYNESRLENLIQFNYYRLVAGPMAQSGGCSYCGDEFVLSDQNIYSYDGPHLQYESVTEYHNQNGKTIYTYYPYPVVSYDPYFNNRISRTALPWRHANLKSKREYSQNDNVVNQSLMEYSPVNISPFENKSLVLAFRYFCPNIYNTDPLLISNVIAEGIDPYFTDKYGKTREINILSSDNGIFLRSDTTNIIYNARWQPFHLKKTRSQGGHSEQTIYYAEDFNNIPNSTISTLKGKNITGRPLKIVHTTAGQTSGGHLATLDTNGNPTGVYSFESVANHVHQASMHPSSDFTLEDSRSYNSRGKVSGFITRDGIQHVYLWSYNFTHPVALVSHATFSEVSAVIGDPELFGALNSESAINAGITALRNGLPSAQITSALYFPGIGIKQMHSPDGMLFTYEYDNLNRLLLVRDRNGNAVDTYTYQNALTLIVD